MAVKKRAINGPRKVGQSLAKEALARRKQAEKKRAAALRVLPKVAKKSVAANSVRAGLSAGILIAEGDSWFDYPFNDVLKALEDDYGYDIETVAKAGDRVEDMAYSGGQLDEFVRRIEKLLRRGDVPQAILLSGGGNDIAGEVEFSMLINHAASSINGLNASVVDGVIDQRLYDAYATILTAVTTVCQRTIGHSVPILVHGYDYAVPDGRGVLGGWWRLPGPWLEPGFRQKGYTQMAIRKQIIKSLIDRFNIMLARVAKHPEFAHVRYVDLRQTLSTETNYKDDWANELHPTGLGFDAVAKKFAALL